MNREREKGKVSIVIPVYNREKVIKRAIESCQSQSYRNIEILVVDDHSDDKTAEVVKTLMQSDSRIYLITNTKNKHGANVARNIGLHYSNGEYIAFLDSDDYLLQYSLEARIQCLEQQKEAVMVYGNAYCEKHGKRIFWKYDDIEKYNQKKYLMKELSLCQTNTILFKGNILNAIGYLDEELKAWNEDDLVISIGLRYKIVYCDKPVCVVVKSSQSITSNKSNTYFGLKSLIKKYKKQIILEVGIKRYCIWKVRLFNNWILYIKQRSNNILILEFLNNIHDLIKKYISSYFNHYFE